MEADQRLVFLHDAMENSEAMNNPATIKSGFDSFITKVDDSFTFLKNQMSSLHDDLGSNWTNEVQQAYDEISRALEGELTQATAISDSFKPLGKDVGDLKTKLDEYVRLVGEVKNAETQKNCFANLTKPVEDKFTSSEEFEKALEKYKTDVTKKNSADSNLKQKQGSLEAVRTECYRLIDVINSDLDSEYVAELVAATEGDFELEEKTYPDGRKETIKRYYENGKVVREEYEIIDNLNISVDKGTRTFYDNGNVKEVRHEYVSNGYYKDYNRVDKYNKDGRMTSIDSERREGGSKIYNNVHEEYNTETGKIISRDCDSIQYVHETHEGVHEEFDDEGFVSRRKCKKITKDDNTVSEDVTTTYDRSNPERVTITEEIGKQTDNNGVVSEGIKTVYDDSIKGKYKVTEEIERQEYPDGTVCEDISRKYDKNTGNKVSEDIGTETNSDGTKLKGQHYEYDKDTGEQESWSCEERQNPDGTVETNLSADGKSGAHAIPYPDTDYDGDGESNGESGNGFIEEEEIDLEDLGIPSAGDTEQTSSSKLSAASFGGLGGNNRTEKASMTPEEFQARLNGSSSRTSTSGVLVQDQNNGIDYRYPPESGHGVLIQNDNSQGGSGESTGVFIPPEPESETQPYVESLTEPYKEEFGI